MEQKIVCLNSNIDIYLPYEFQSPLITIPENFRANIKSRNVDYTILKQYTEDELKVLRHIDHAKLQLCNEIEILESRLIERCNGKGNVPQMGEKERRRRQLLSSGKNAFNENGKKGIAFLVKHDLINYTPEDVASFLFGEKGLSKKAIGDYIGENDMFNISTLHAYVALHNFKGKILVRAIRNFLSSFYLPGEAQKIDRIMEAFAKVYCFQRPLLFDSDDACYILSFSLIMLNTNLHNSLVKDKLSLPKFISMNRGINEGKNLPEDMLAELYRDVFETPFRPPTDDTQDLDTFCNPTKEGWLNKEGGKHKSVKARWFILNNNCLYYFVNNKDTEPKGIIPLEDLSVKKSLEKPHCFEIYPNSINTLVKGAKTDSSKRMVAGHHQTYRVMARNDKERDEWMSAINACIIASPIQKLLESKRSYSYLQEAHTLHIK